MAQPRAPDPFKGTEENTWPIPEMDFPHAASTIAVPHKNGQGWWARDVAIVSFPQLLICFKNIYI